MTVTPRCLRVRMIANSLRQLLVGERGGGLVHDQHRGGEGEGLDDLHHLLLDHGQLFHLAVHGQLDADLSQQGAGALPGGPAVQVAQEARGFPVQEHVLGHGEAADQAELLEDDADPGLLGFARIAEGYLLAVQQDAPGVGLVDPAQDLHQRGLARPVLPDQGVHLPPAKLEADLLQGPDPGEGSCRSLPAAAPFPPQPCPRSAFFRKGARPCRRAPLASTTPRPALQLAAGTRRASGRRRSTTSPRGRAW